MEQEAIALFEQNLTDATTEAQRRTVEELRVLMHRNLPYYLNRTYGTKPARGKRAELRAADTEAFRSMLDKDPNLRASFFIHLIVRDHFDQLIYRSIDSGPRAKDRSFNVKEMKAWMFDYATRAREELYPAGLRPEPVTRRKIANMVLGLCRRGLPRGCPF
jgi:hypothetical protein